MLCKLAYLFWVLVASFGQRVVCQEEYAEVQDAAALRAALSAGVQHIRVINHLLEANAADFGSKGVFEVTATTKSITGNCTVEPTTDWGMFGLGEWPSGVCLIEIGVHHDSSLTAAAAPPTFALLPDDSSPHTLWLSALYLFVVSTSQDATKPVSEVIMVPAIKVEPYPSTVQGEGRKVYMTDVSVECFNSVLSPWHFYPLQIGSPNGGKPVHLLANGGTMTISERDWNLVSPDFKFRTVWNLYFLVSQALGGMVANHISLQNVQIQLPWAHVEPLFVYTPLYLSGSTLRLEESDVDYQLGDTTGLNRSTLWSPEAVTGRSDVWVIGVPQSETVAESYAWVYCDSESTYIVNNYDQTPYNASQHNFQVLSLEESAPEPRSEAQLPPFLTLEDEALLSLRAEVAELSAAIEAPAVTEPPSVTDSADGGTGGQPTVPRGDDGPGTSISGSPSITAGEPPSDSNALVPIIVSVAVAVAVVAAILAVVIYIRHRQRRGRQSSAPASDPYPSEVVEIPSHYKPQAVFQAPSSASTLALSAAPGAMAVSPHPLVPNKWVTMTSTMSTQAMSLLTSPMTMTPRGATTSASSQTAEEHVQLLEDALDHMHAHQQKLEGRWTLLSGVHRRAGAQGLVQFIRDEERQLDCACKFFFDAETFQREAALYVQPAMRDMMAAIVHMAAPGTPCPVIGSLPAWIVLERGSSLSDWAAVQQPDMMTAAVVLNQILQRLARLHSLAYVHRDIKPANILWREGAKSWTLIDFGCVVQQGTMAPLSFSLLYAAPEVIHAFERSESTMMAEASLDIWSIGVVLFELLTKESAFDRQASAETIQDQIAGRKLLPWESSEPECKAKLARLGILKSSVLACLSRDPKARPTAEELLRKVEHVFSRATTNA